MPGIKMEREKRRGHRIRICNKAEGWRSSGEDIRGSVKVQEKRREVRRQKKKEKEK